jgi:flagellar hook protein FlgE
MGFSQALSGLTAASTDLEVVSNNISNSQTVGFKSSTVQFADVYSGADVGLGTTAWTWPSMATVSSPSPMARRPSTRVTAS